MNKLLQGLTAVSAAVAIFAACTQPKQNDAAPELTASGLNPEQFADTIACYIIDGKRIFYISK